ncbi:hypothetical protein V493_01038 [Pseudogymnoascus sp. VKM F-4281 (FW-2241)]|nr:hypothetical protein V493_01038 [Pseudogymnoascus sp. VKM F-4281 (FW-2241)]
MSSQPPVQLIIRFQGNEEDLDVAEAFAQRPKDVREAILDAVRLTKPPKNEMNLLAIESSFWYSLEKVKETWGEPRVFRSVLDACRQGCLKDKTEGLFYDLGGAADVIALAVATVRHKNTLHRSIDALPVEELRRLIDHVHKIPKGAVIDELAARYMRIGDKGNATARQPSNPQSPGRSKKRRCTLETPHQFQHPYLPPLNSIGFPTARQPSQTLAPMRLAPLATLRHQGPRDILSNAKSAVKGYSPVEKQRQHHNMRLDSPQQPRGICQDTIHPKSTEYSPDGVLLQSNSVPPPRKMDQEVSIPFAEGQPELACDDYEAYLQDGSTALDLDFDTYLQGGPTTLDLDFETYLQGGPTTLNLDFDTYLHGGQTVVDLDFGTYLQGGPTTVDVENNDSGFNLEEAQSQSEHRFDNTITRYAQGLHPYRDTRGVIVFAVE